MLKLYSRIATDLCVGRILLYALTCFFVDSLKYDLCLVLYCGVVVLCNYLSNDFEHETTKERLTVEPCLLNAF